MERFAPRKKIRLEEYSYSQDGVYFVTICAADRTPIFGRIEDNHPGFTPAVRLNSIGEIVLANIQKIPIVYPCISVDKYVIMPNHIHLLLKITNSVLQREPKRDKMLLSKCIQSFKASVSRTLSGQVGSVWQSRYYDHIVRNDADYKRIWKYIDDNPARWGEDDYYVK